MCQVVAPPTPPTSHPACGMSPVLQVCALTANQNVFANAFRERDEPIIPLAAASTPCTPCNPCTRTRPNWHCWLCIIIEFNYCSTGSLAGGATDLPGGAWAGAEFSCFVAFCLWWVTKPSAGHVASASVCVCVCVLLCCIRIFGKFPYSATEETHTHTLPQTDRTHTHTHTVSFGQLLNKLGQNARALSGNACQILTAIRYVVESTKHSDWQTVHSLETEMPHERGKQGRAEIRGQAYIRLTEMQNYWS